MGNRSRGKKKAKQITLLILSLHQENQRFPFSRWGDGSRAVMIQAQRTGLRPTQNQKSGIPSFAHIPPGLCSKDPQTNNSMERVITLPSLRSLGLQLKCFELVLLPKAAPPALQTPPRHTLGTPRRYRPAARKAGLAHVAQAPVSAIGENEKVGRGRKRRSLSFGSCAE